MLVSRCVSSLVFLLQIFAIALAVLKSYFRLSVRLEHLNRLHSIPFLKIISILSLCVCECRSGHLQWAGIEPLEGAGLPDEK